MERPGRILVIDASVVTKWYIEEDYSSQALALRNDYVKRRVDLASSQLLPYEVLNALKRNPEFGPEDLRTVAKSLQKATLPLYPILGELADSTIEMAVKYGITIYDSSYIALADFLGSTAFTADEKLLAKVGKTAAFSHISNYGKRHLGAH